MKNKTIKVDYLARVEGEGGLTVKIKDGAVTDVQFNIFEPPRFFEAFLRGRSFTEVPDMVARICGICPVAHQMSSSTAIEQACGAKVDGVLREIRRLLYLGEWIESHALHVYLLHAPDFLGYQDVIGMAADHKELVTQALRLKKIGNRMMTVIGGREIHPINPKVGGFYSVATRKELLALKSDLEWALEFSLQTVKVCSGLKFPDLERDYELVSLRHETEYPVLDGRLVSNKGLDIEISEFLDFFEEDHVKHSTSLHARSKKRADYLVGPLARYANNFDRLSELCQKSALDAGLTEKVNNPFKSIIVRAVELVYACEESLKIIDAYQMPEAPSIVVDPKNGEGVGFGGTEAPRGLLFHRYEIGRDGLVTNATIMPPTSQNQLTIETDLRQFTESHMDLPDDQLTWQCEQVVRNYDPCISCSCHFLRLERE